MTATKSDGVDITGYRGLRLQIERTVVLSKAAALKELEAIASRITAGIDKLETRDLPDLCDTFSAAFKRFDQDKPEWAKNISRLILKTADQRAMSVYKRGETELPDSEFTPHPAGSLSCAIGEPNRQHSAA